ncbi:DUF7563 family protein [Halapricum hydrolyticum]
MPECANCGSHVSEHYARVFTPDGGQPQACPNCPNRKRGANGRAVKKRV